MKAATAKKHFQKFENSFLAKPFFEISWILSTYIFFSDDAS